MAKKLVDETPILVEKLPILFSNVLVEIMQ
jgi:hypothetical protein